MHCNSLNIWNGPVLMHFLPLSRFFGIYVLKLSTLRTLIRAVLSKPVGISTVEYFVALFFGLSALFTCHLTDPARRPGIAQPQYRQYSLIWSRCRYRGGGGDSSLKEAALLCPSVALISLWLWMTVRFNTRFGNTIIYQVKNI